MNNIQEEEFFECPEDCNCHQCYDDKHWRDAEENEPDGLEESE